MKKSPDFGSTLSPETGRQNELSVIQFNSKRILKLIENSEIVVKAKKQDFFLQLCTSTLEMARKVQILVQQYLQKQIGKMIYL